MKLYDGGVLIVIGIIALAMAVGIFSSHKLGEDNAVEEQCEKIIEDQTGLNIDLSDGDDPDGGTNWLHLLSDRDM